MQFIRLPNWESGRCQFFEEKTFLASRSSFAIATVVFTTIDTSVLSLNKILRFERSEGGIIMLKGGQQIPVSVRKRENLTSILSELY